MTHAKLPWSWQQWGETIGIDNGDFMNLAVINPNGDHSKGIPSRLDAGNAAFIVLACNNHNELVAALEILAEHAQETYPHFESERGQQDIRRALDAISKAKGN